MQGLQTRVLLAMAMVGSASAASAQFSDDDFARTDRAPFAIATSQKAGYGIDRDMHVEPPRVFQFDGAPFVKLHFSRLDLPAGAFVEIVNPETGESWRYSSSYRDPFTTDADIGDDGVNRFWAMSVSGDQAIVRLVGDLSRYDPARHGYAIDDWYTGRSGAEGADPPIAKSKNVEDSLETNCGDSELYDAVCWADSYPNEYDRSYPVALIITTSGKECTAWRVGDENRMFTARHCIASQAELDGAEIWFDYQAEVCGGGYEGSAVKVTGDELLAQDYYLDYALFTVNDFAAITRFGNLGVDLRDGVVGEGIFIPQHGLGNPKQIAIESDMNPGGFCVIDANDLDGFEKGSDIGYMCDTTTSSSGSPVISAVTGQAIALHHWGGCLNSGTKLAYIWPQVRGFFKGVPEGDVGAWGAPNDPPTAEFSASCDGLECRFDGSESYDGDGDISNWSWEIEGTELNGAEVDYTFDAGGDYDITLTVTDDEGATDFISDTVSVTPPNEVPTARFSTYCVETSCTFDGAGSSDPDGTIASWKWRLGDGTTATGDRVEHQYAKAGSYSVNLTVRDDAEAEDTSSQTVTVTAPNEAPDALFDVSCDADTCTVDAGASRDPDGEILVFDWDFGDGSSATGPTAEHRFASSGAYTITLSVTDDDGATSQASQPVRIEEPNVAPKARFEANCTGASCGFDASSSSDEDGEVVRYEWTFGDGTSATGRSVGHEYGGGGSFDVMLTIVDDDGATDTSTQPVRIELPNAAPMARFNGECSDGVCNFDASASSDDDGTIERYEWTFGDGASGVGRVVEHSYDEDGRYTVMLTVIDDEGAQGAKTLIFEVVLPAAEPEADFSVDCDDLNCTLDAGSSTASTATIAQYDWAFGDGTTATGSQVSHVYDRPGRYTVTLKITDSNKASNSRNRTIEVESGAAVELTAEARRVKLRTTVSLNWSNTFSSSVNVYRNGERIATVPNRGNYIDGSLKTGTGSYAYQVCEASTDRCSNTEKIIVSE